VQATWNLLEPSAGPALAEASAAGWGVIVKEAVANGRLTPHGHGSAAAVLARVAARHGVGVDAVALAAVLANPWADVVLSGAVTPAQLTSNLAALRVELDPGELAELATLAEPPERYWEERAGLSWS
jgi:aryl-alcohol dehydrogenase-like predicted oxidoreductase